MFRYALNILLYQPLRLFFTIVGVALCVILMLFLLGVYRGIEFGSMEYIRQNRADMWVLQKNSWNVLRGSSLIPSGVGDVIMDIEGIESASPVLFLLPGVRYGEKISTVFLIGYDPEKPLGKPPHILEGRTLSADDEIVIDKAFSKRMGAGLGDTVSIDDHRLVVVGISTNTNAFVIQYVFVTVTRAQRIAGIPGIVSAFMIKHATDRATADMRTLILSDLPGVEIYDHETFVANNLKEMKSGMLPLLFIIAAIAAIVLTAILSLLLSINILERRKDYAVMKILGSPARGLIKSVLGQALMLGLSGSVIGMALFFPVCACIEIAAPEMSPQSSAGQIAVVHLSVAVISTLSSLISLQRLRRIFPLEVFE
jgi:putative ABC transport system permease protein